MKMIGTKSSAIRVLVGNKVDTTDRQVTTEEAEDYADNFGFDYFETAATSGLRVNEVCTHFTSNGY